MALYKGFVPKVLRLGPGGGVLLLVVEVTLGVFRKGMAYIFIGSTSSNCAVAFSSWPSVYMSRYLG
jgi:hypothetical protein